MNRPKITRDKAAGGVRVGCSACPHWHAFASSLGAAHQSGSTHERLVHPGEYRARNAAKMYARRHPESADTPTRIMNV